MRLKLEQERKARKHVDHTATDYRDNKKAVDLASYRFQKTYATPFIPAGFQARNQQSGSSSSGRGGGSGHPSQAAEDTTPAVSFPTVALPQQDAYSTHSQQQHGSSSSHHHQRNSVTRSDDFMMQQFKKVSSVSQSVSHRFALLCFALLHYLT